MMLLSTHTSAPLAWAASTTALMSVICFHSTADTRTTWVRGKAAQSDE